MPESDLPYWYHPTYLSAYNAAVFILVLGSLLFAALGYLGVWERACGVCGVVAGPRLLPHSVREKQRKPGLWVHGSFNWAFFARRIAAPVLCFWGLAFLGACGYSLTWMVITQDNMVVPSLALHDPRQVGSGEDFSADKTAVMHRWSTPSSLPRTSPQRVAVFGMYTTAPPPQLQRFLRTLRGTGCEADVFIVTDTAEAYLPTLAEFSSKEGGGAFAVELAFGPVTRWDGIAASSVRFSAYRHMLQEWGLSEKYDAVMFADVTDVVFQRDPFDIIRTEAGGFKPGLHAFLENERNTMEYPDINAEWISQCFGNAAMHRLWGKRASCSGTTLATTPHALKYLTLQDRFSRQHPWCGRHGNDQGLHNYIVHSDLVQPTVKYSLERGPIMTLDRVDHLLFDEASGNLVNDERETYHVVHQIRRCWHFTGAGGIPRGGVQGGEILQSPSRWDCNVLEKPQLRLPPP